MMMKQGNGKPMFERQSEELAEFLRRPGLPEPSDVVTPEERITGKMPTLETEDLRIWRDFGDCMALLGIGAFLGSIITLALERVWLP